MKQTDKVILGIDPGTSVMGYGVIQVKAQDIKLLQFGVVHLSKYDDPFLKIQKIYEKASSLIEEFHPDEMALEAPFYGKNVQSMLKLGRAQGVAMSAALNRQIPISEYAPRKIKQSVCGNGNASKEQVAKMLMMLLKFKEMPQLLDATDALAVAVCHHYQQNIIGGKSKSWKSFIRDNPGRIR